MSGPRARLAGATTAASTLALAVAFAVAGTGCGTDGGGAVDGGGDGAVAIDAGGEIDAPGEECTPIVGELGRPVEVRPVYADHASTLIPIGVDGAVELIVPPQGGVVVMAGLAARNLRGCGGAIKGTLRDPGTGAVIAMDERLGRLIAGADGWGVPAYPPIVTTSNLMLCPQAMLPRDIDGNRWRLELSITDDDGRTGSWAGEVVPTCWAGGIDPEACPCQCDSEFVFGQPCPVDP